MTTPSTTAATNWLAPEILALGVATPTLNTQPLPTYGYDRLDYGMTIGIARTHGGRLWACWVGGGDNDHGFFVLASSDDDGVTWSAPRLVIDPHDATLPCHRRTLVGALWTDPQGRLWVFFDQSLSYYDGRDGDWYTRCDAPDAAVPVWTPPVRIWHGCTLNKPTIIASGDWLLPISLWSADRVEQRFQGAFPELESQRGAHVFASSDGGATWSARSAGPVVFPKPDFDEHMIVQRRDGSLFMWARTRDSIWMSDSGDAGRSWSAPRPSGIANINARFHLRRLLSGRLLLIKHGTRIDQRTPTRSHLTAFLSDDDGASWYGGLVLDERETISYPDGDQAPDGTIYISYDYNRASHGEILLARFTETDIANGRIVSPRSALRQLISRPLAAPAFRRG